MTKNEAKAALIAGGTMLYVRGICGLPSRAHINGKTIRVDTALKLIDELDIHGKKTHSFNVTVYRVSASQ